MYVTWFRQHNEGECHINAYVYQAINFFLHNSFLLVQLQAIIWTNADLLLSEHLETWIN